MADRSLLAERHEIFLHFGKKKVPFTVRKHAWDQGILVDVFARDEYELKEIKHPVTTVVDVGAHIGGFSRLASLLWPHAAIRAYEADLDNFALLMHNAVGFLPVYGAMTELSFTGLRRVPWSSHIERCLENTGAGCLSDFGSEEVPAVPVDEIFAPTGLHSLAELDLLKIDTEGSEVRILEGLHRIGRLQDVKTVVGEWHGFLRRDELVEFVHRTRTHSVQIRAPEPGKDCSTFHMARR